MIFRSLAVAAILACTGGSLPPNAVPAPVRSLTATELPGILPDTLAYKFNWTAGANATGYQLNVYPIAGDVGGWVTVPQFMPAATANTNLSVKLINGGQWDSVRFRVVVKSTRGSTVSRDSSVAEWWVRKLGAPGPVIVDSSLVVIGMRAVKLPIDSATYAVCPIVKFGKKGEAIPARYSAAPCNTVAVGLATSAKQQAIADTLTLAISHTDKTGAFKLELPN